MTKIITARVDPETEENLRSLKKSLGISESQIIREGIKLMHKTKQREEGKSKIIGLGVIESKFSDLASNKKHLKKFGK